MKKLLSKINIEEIKDKINNSESAAGWVLGGIIVITLLIGLYNFIDSNDGNKGISEIQQIHRNEKVVDLEMIGMAKTESLEDSLQSLTDEMKRNLKVVTKSVQVEMEALKSEIAHIKESRNIENQNQAIQNYVSGGKDTEYALIEKNPDEKESIEAHNISGELLSSDSVGNDFSIIQAGNEVLKEKKPRLTFGAGKICSGFLLNGTRSSTSADASSNPNLVMIQITDFGNFPKEFMEDIDEATAFGEAIADISAELVYIRVYMINITKNDGKEYTVDAGKGSNLGYAICKKTGIVGSSGKVTDNSISIMRKAFMANGLSAVAEFFKNRGMVAGTTLQNGAVVTKIGAKDQVEGAMASGAAKSLEKLADFYIKKAESITPVIQIEAGHEVVIVFPQKVKVRTCR